MKVHRGDVVLVDYPFSDPTGCKVRPALVVQNDLYSRHIDDTILASISRSAHRTPATQLFVDIDTAEGAATGWRQNSMIQCENLLTYDQGLIIAIIGKLPPALLTRVDSRLREALSL